MKSTPLLLLLVYLFAFGWPLSAAAQSTPAHIKAQAVEMTRALLKKDHQKFVSYMHPRVIEAGGGPDKVMQMMDTMQNQMVKFGAKVKKITIGNPSTLIKEKNSWQCTLPQTSQFSFMGNEIEATTTLIAISEDQGRHWYFLDTSVYGEKRLKSLLPSLSPNLVIPKMSPPKIQPANGAPMQSP